MHGRKRVGIPPPTPEELSATQKKVDKFKLLSTLALKHRSQHTLSLDSLELISQLLSANPDMYTLWNYAREQLMVFSGEVVHESVAPLSEAAFAGVLKAQLGVTVAALKRSPKSYPAWYHRRWLVEKYRGGGKAGLPPTVSLQEELALCSQMLALDERNFHCWNYRRWVAGLAGEEQGGGGNKVAVAAAELAFTDEKIAVNFSNYSAWHARSHLLQARFDTMSLTERAKLAASELSLVRKAVFTEPDDQSAWFYHRWVVNSLVAVLDGSKEGGAGDATTEAEAASRGALQEDLQALKELSEAEPRCKWPIEARAHVLSLLSTRGGGGGEGSVEDEVSLYLQLEALDPRHAQYYRYMARKKVPA